MHVTGVLRPGPQFVLFEIIGNKRPPSVLENVLVPLLADGKLGQEDIAQASQLIERVGLGERQHFALPNSQGVNGNE